MVDGKLVALKSINSQTALKSLAFMMFAMFAMTTDSVGTVIPEIIKEFRLGLTAAGSFQYASMSGIGISAIALGFLADRIGRKITILAGLLLFGASSALFAAGHSLGLFTTLLFFAGLGIGIFKAGALALIGDISNSTCQHTTNMNLLEGFFGVGAIIGPAIVAWLVQSGLSWKWIYLIAAILCAMLIVLTAATRFPQPQLLDQARSVPGEAVRMARQPAALFFGLALMLYVGGEAAVYVWAPTYLSGGSGDLAWLALYAVSAFFMLRAVGRFLGAWLLGRYDWSTVLIVCTTAVALLFWVAVIGGPQAGIVALPATGIFMSVLYPTINSTGISCFEKSKHGAISGLLLFFTCLSAVLAPLGMAALGDGLGDTRYSIALGASMTTVLALLCFWNWARQPFAALLFERNAADYAGSGTDRALADMA